MGLLRALNWKNEIILFISKIKLLFLSYATLPSEEKLHTIEATQLNVFFLNKNYLLSEIQAL